MANKKENTYSDERDEMTIDWFVFCPRNSGYGSAATIQNPTVPHADVADDDH